MQPLLQVINITKHFPGTLALDQVQLELLPGEIHAVMGENGAGKSTLMKILSGVHQADAGQIKMNGIPIRPSNPREALTLGIAIVYQELSMIPTLTVAENIFPGHLPTNKLGMVNYRQLYQNAAQVLEKMYVHVDPRVSVETLSIANQQLIEISKALSSNCKILILDEPTSALTDTEAEHLLSLLRHLASEGVSILYISHKLNEVFALAHRITVLRDGKFIGTEKVADVTPDHIIRMMVGRELGAMYPDKTTERGQLLFEVRDLRLPSSDAHNSFKLNRGEILGFAGLIGSGRSELARVIFGANPKAAGKIFLNGEPMDFHSPQDAIKHGVGYLPEDRKAAGLFLDMSIRFNIAAAVIPQVSTNGFLVLAKEKALAQGYVQRLGVSTPGIEQEVRRLSGGNQQKTLVAKWLAIKPKILIVDEPTRGIDVGAKKEIHFLLRKLAESGVGVIIISSELPEILGMSDRILVMHEGAIAAEYATADATEEKIIRSASGQ
ncbi:MAG: ATP-binding cassette domain-containing protein [Anaerolineaceae bacterium]|nr:ATP-binding cassette domain-containing protein [Anaerolineaceae bacterium]